MELTDEELMETYPRLWHMAHDGAWPAIRDHGLMSSGALLDAYGVTGDERACLIGERRPESDRLLASAFRAPCCAIRSR
jgi:hypothetical protein